MCKALRCNLNLPLLRMFNLQPRAYNLVLGIRFDNITISDVLSRFDQAIKNKEQLFCVTPNPEMCLLATRNKPFAEILNSASLSIPDGFGILWGSRYLNGKHSFLRWLFTLMTPWMSSSRSPLQARVSGVDVMREYLHQYPHRKIFLLGASKAVNDRLTAKLKDQGVKVVGNFSGNDSEKLALIIISMIVLYIPLGY